MKKTTLLIITLAAAQSLAAQQPAPAPPPNPSPVKEIIVVIKTHFDIGYTHSVKEIVHHYRTGMIDNAMNIMDQSQSLPPEQQFAWTGPGWVMSKVLEDWEGQTPARRQRLDDYVKAGKFQFHALPFTLESDACEPEGMARGFIFSSALCRKHGMPLPHSGKMTDVPSHGAALATVLAHGGVKFMHIGCNWPSGAVETPGLFWWEGPDGSRVLTFYSNTYGTCVPPWMPRWYCAQDPFISTGFGPTPDWPYPVWPAILVTPDNTGPPTAEQVTALFDEATAKFPGVKIRMGTMDDFVDAILKANPDIPVVMGEMPDTWIHGVMCDPGGIKLSREVHAQIAAAEALHTSLNLWGIARPPVAGEVARAYENILLYGEHTWGRAPSVNQYGDAFKTANPKLIADLEASWEDKTDYIREAARISRGIMAGNLQTLASAVKRDAPGMVVYNPLPWTRSGAVEIDGASVFVKDMPPSGYKTLPLPPAGMRMAPRTTTEPATLENESFKLTLDPAKGAITSLVDKRTGREWVDAAEPRGLGQYLNERFTFEQTLNYTVAYQAGRAFKSFGAKGEWPHPGMHKPGMISEQQVPYRAAMSVKGTATIDGQTATIECPADPANHLPATTLRITLPAGQPSIDLEITIKDKAKDNWPEADWLCLPFKIASPQFRVHRALGVMNPVTDILPGANRDLFSVGHGVTIADADGSGIAVCPLDHPLVSLDRPGCWQASKNADEFTPRKPVVYLNLYNNQWNTNFRYWYPGTWSSRVRLWTFDKHTAPDAIMATPALEARNPLVAAATTGAGGKLPARQSGVTVARKGVLVTAFGPNPDGAGTLLRVWEMAGVAGDLTVTIPGKFASATPVNLRGEKSGRPLAIANGTLSCKLSAYAPASFVLDTVPPPPAASGAAHSVRAGDFEARWSDGGSGPAFLRVADTVSGRSLALQSGFIPALKLSGGVRLELGPVLAPFRDGTTAASRAATIGDNPHGLRGGVKFTAFHDPSYMIQELILTATRDLIIDEIVFLDTELADAEMLGEVDGSVVRCGDFFLAVEHPLAKVSFPADGRLRCALPRGNTLKAGMSWTFSTVIGLAPEGQFRRGFQHYLEQRRAHSYRPFIHYNSWYHLNIDRPGNRMTENECLDALRHITKELTETRKLAIDAYVWDDGWDDHNSLWGFHDSFPEGFTRLREEAARTGAAMGVWLSPWGGYGAPQQARVEFGRAHGFETNARGLSMALSKYGAAFRDRCFQMMDGQGVEFFKFDGMGGGNMVSGASAEAAADIDAMLDLTRQLREKNPAVFISATVGTWPSPFWLLHADSIWRQGEDTGFAGPGNGRERWITYRDAQTYRNIVRRGPLYPLNSLMIGGLVVGERANPAKMPLNEVSVRNEARAMAGSGTCLQELYIAPNLLTAPMWDAIAESMTWLRKRAAAFADVHWLGGDPAAGDIYGWAGWHEDTAIGVLTLRNPSDKPRTWSFDPAGALGIPAALRNDRYQLLSPYPDQRVRQLTSPPHAPLAIELLPHEVLSFEITTATAP